MTKELSDWVKGLVGIAKKNGHVTFDDMNAALPSDQLTSAQIEEAMGMLAALEITIVDETSCDSRISYQEACARGVRRMEMAISALRHGRSRHACKLMETTVSEIKSFDSP